jgi:hypothetical protein
MDQDGEFWPSTDLFHGFDDPSVFGPTTKWGTDALLVLRTPTHAAANSPTLDLDAEDTNLPPGLLNSPPELGIEPHQTKIDHVFITKDWELAHPNYHL